MFKKFLRNFSKNTAQNELRKYYIDIDVADDYHLTIVLSHALMLYCALKEKSPIVEEVIASDQDLINEANEFVLITTDLAKNFNSTRAFENASGVMLLNHTFRCLRHPELSMYGVKIWSKFENVRESSKEYLNELISDNNRHSDRAKEALNYINLVPEKFK